MFTLLQNDSPPSSAEPQARIPGIPARGQSPGHGDSAELDSIVSLRLRFSEQNRRPSTNNDQPTLSLRRPPNTTTPAVSKTASPHHNPRLRHRLATVGTTTDRRSQSTTCATNPPSMTRAEASKSNYDTKQLFYYGFRYFNSETGRWLSKDPIGELGGINLYSFVENNSLSYWDLLGLTTTIEIGYTNTPVPGTNHALVIATDTQSGEQFASRAGPEAAGPSGSASESSQSSSGGYASASSGNGSSGGFGFGQIDAQSGPYNEDFRDPPSNVHTVQDVGTIDRDFNDVVNNMREFESVTDSNQIPYGPLGHNSNSYAFTLTESLTGERPEPDVNSPGWRSGKPDEDLSYEPANSVQCNN